MPSIILHGASPLGFVSFLSFNYIPPKVFRCICYIHKFGLNFDKLDLRATKCVLVYYRIQKRHCYHSLILWQYFTNANATFFWVLPIFFRFCYLSDCDLEPLTSPIPLLFLSNLPSPPNLLLFHILFHHLLLLHYRFILVAWNHLQLVSLHLPHHLWIPFRLLCQYLCLLLSKKVHTLVH